MLAGSTVKLPEHLVVAITGASGALYAKRLLDELIAREISVHLIVSEAGEKILRLELGLEAVELVKDNVSRYDYKDFAAKVASGSFPISGMVIIPCSMGTLSAVAHGTSINLIHRCADVCLKERKKLILVPRETPLNSIHLENMLKVSRMGVTILPAMPGFYQRPRSIEDLADFIVARVLDQLGISQNLIQAWDGMSLH